MIPLKKVLAARDAFLRMAAKAVADRLNQIEKNDERMANIADQSRTLSDEIKTLETL